MDVKVIEVKTIIDTEATMKNQLSPNDKTKYIDIKIDPEHSLESITQPHVDFNDDLNDDLHISQQESFQFNYGNQALASMDIEGAGTRNKNETLPNRPKSCLQNYSKMQNTEAVVGIKGKLMKFSNARKGSNITGSIYEKSRQSQIINDDISMVGVGIEPKGKTFKDTAQNRLIQFRQHNHTPIAKDKISRVMSRNQRDMKSFNFLN